MTDEPQGDQNIHAEENSIAFGSISVGGNTGDIRIGHTIGFTSDQVSTLLTQISTTFQPKPFDGRCPYKGLDYFEESDADMFFGREKLVAELVSRVQASRTLFITGPSGSGKSSLGRAGLIHALKQGELPGSDKWLYATMKPGREPITTLAQAVAGLVMSTNAEDEIRARAMNDETIFARWCEIALQDGRDKRVVLYIDQFEEVFTQISKEEERIAFLNLLTYSASVENGRVILLFSMRSDFIPNCATYPKLNAVLNRQFVQIGSMQQDELVSAIAQPALRVGLKIDPDLIAQIIHDMHGEPGALPLMQFALKDLFDAQQEKGGLIALTLNDYLQRGGIHKALERHADTTFSQLSENEQELARSIFTGLIEIGRGTQDTRRTAVFEELVPASQQSADVEAIVRKLADARLVTTDEVAGKDTVTISHEKLIDAWPWLKKLVNENRDVIALQNEIAVDAKEWEEHQHDSSYLYTGARLANAREQLEAKKLVLSGTAHEFVLAGQAQQRRSRRTRVLGVAVPIALTMLAIVLFSYILSTNATNQAKLSKDFAETQQASASTSDAIAAIAQANADEAQKQNKIARAGELAAQAISQRDKQFDLSLLLSVEAFHTANTTRTRSVLLDNTLTNPALAQYLHGHSDSVYDIALSPDGKTMASGSRDHTIILWNMETHQPLDQPLQGHSGSVLSVAFSPDGKILASGSVDNTITLWDVDTHQPLGQPLQGHGDWVVSVAFSPDGKTLASGSSGKIILWDVDTHQPIGQPLTGYGKFLAFSPDGKILASGGDVNTIILWDVETHQPLGQPLQVHSISVWSVAFSPDGKILASGTIGDIILWDVETHQPLGQPLQGHSGYVLSVAFSPDGKTLASGGQDNTIILWDTETHQPLGQPLQGHRSWVQRVAFSSDGKILASGSEDDTIILWDVEAHQPFSQPLQGHSASVPSVTFSPDGKILASGSYDATIILWDVDTHQPIGQPLQGHSDYVFSVAFSTDGKILASGGQDNTIILWDVETHQPIGQPLQEHNGSVFSVAFSPDGKTLASASGDNTIILWDVDTHQPIGQPLKDYESLLAFSPDGKMLVLRGFDDTIILWDVETHQPISQPLRGHSGSALSVAFSPDGKILASGSEDNTIILWDVDTHQPIGRPLQGHSDSVFSVAFSPDGKTLASGSMKFSPEDKTLASGAGSVESEIILWDVETHQPISQPLRGHSGSALSVAFSPDGKILASASNDGTILLWDLDPERWVTEACHRVGRNFTRAEWSTYFPNEEYRKTCEQWPLEPEPQVTPTATP